MRYSELFVIELLHEFYTDGKVQGLKLIPTPACEQLLRGRQLLFRQIANVGYTLCKVNDDRTPFVPLDPGAVFQFYLKSQDSSFFGKTPLPFDPATTDRLQLSSLAANESGGLRYLTRPIPAFSTASSYAPGDLVTSDPDLFESIKTTAAAPGNTVTDAAHWTKRGPVRAPSPADALAFTSTDAVLTAPAPVATATVEIFGLNSATNLYDQLRFSEVLNFAGPTADVPVHLTGLGPGRYHVTAAGAAKSFYYDPAVQPREVIGCIEIFSHLNAANSYSLLDATDRVKATRFTVQFLNRLVIWKYIARTSNVKAIKDEAAVYTFDNSVPLEFRSNTPIPVTEKPYDKIAMDYKPVAAPLTTYGKLANPSLTHLREIDIVGDDLLCAEIYLNH
jgi:hypothetical protein